MEDGKALYIEGSNVGLDHSHGNLWDYFGCNYEDDGGIYAITKIYGINETFAAVAKFDFPYDDNADYLVDEFTAEEGTLFLKCQEQIGRAVFYDNENYRTIVSAISLGALHDGENTSSKTNLMARYLSFLTYDSAPHLWVSENEIDFTTQYLGYPTSKYLTLQNTGFETLEITAIEFEGTTFSIATEDEYRLRWGQQVDIEITFPAENLGVFTEEITIYTDDTENEIITIPLVIECIEPDFTFGDVNGDGSITVYDASLTLQNFANLIEFENWQLIAADVDGNGVIQSYDASLILQFAVGLIIEFPVD